MPYTIHFENETNATAPAQQVVVSDRLTNRLDWTTFELTEIAFGDQFIVVPPRTQHFETSVQLSVNSYQFEVQIEAGIRLDTGEVCARFQSLNPTNGLPPPVEIGFLMPENGTGRGQGHVSYVIRPRAGLPTGTEIRNVAWITFDQQPAIATDWVDPHDPSHGVDPNKQALVTIDADPPTSAVLRLPDEVATRFEVQWAGGDGAGAGILGYDVQFAEVPAGGALEWKDWQSNTPLSSAFFEGELHKTYAFRCRARDGVGYVEDWPELADAQTTVTTEFNHPPTITALGDQIVVLGGTLAVPVQATDPDAGQTLTYQLLDKPEGMELTAAHEIVWTPTPAQLGEWPVEVQVTDNGVPPLSAATDFKVTVLTEEETAITMLNEPEDQLLVPGGTSVFSVTAHSSLPLTHQWQHNGTNLADGPRISGATTPVLTLSNLESSDAGVYAAVIANAFTTVTSRVARLIEPFSPVFQSIRLLPERAVEFSFTSVAGIPYVVERLTDCTDTNWAVLTTLTATGAVTTVTDPSPSSPTAFYRVALPVAPGGERIYSVNRVGLTRAEVLSGTNWLANPLPTANDTITNVLPLAPALDGARVVLSGGSANDFSAASGWSDPGMVLRHGDVFEFFNPLPTNVVLSFVGKFEPQPVFAVSPVSHDLRVGTDLQLSALAVGWPPVGYQWRFNGQDLPEATSPTLLLADAQLARTGEYTVVAASPYGALTSRVATVTIRLPENHAPTIEPIPDQTVLAGGRLEVRVSAADSDVGQTLLYGLLEPPGGMAITNTDWIVWTPGLAQLGEWPVLVQVTDNGVPPLSAATGFKVTVERLQFTWVRADDNLRITFPTAAGRKYRVEFTEDLGVLDWQLLDTEVDGTGAPHTMLLPILPDLTQRYYRIVEVP